jgi:D-serine deaminase-like pyridoxal phosphate-dependent protein
VQRSNQREERWWHVENIDEVDSPALLVYPDRAEQNIERMIQIAAGTKRLRPHIKTHKLPPLVRMHLDHGIRQFKCATIAEAEIAAEAGADDVLLAHQPVGPKAKRLVALATAYPKTRFSTIVDDENALGGLSAAAAAGRVTLDVLVDIDCGMHRTGTPPGPEALALYRRISKSAGLNPGGLHAYDGHIAHSDLSQRREAAHAALAPVFALRDELLAHGLAVPRVIAGGTPTFPIHAQRSDIECSPGTCVLWDAGYAAKLPDMDFIPAALVLTRVISKPAPDRLCLDLGHKAIASENPHPRVQLLELPEARAVSHSEEHLVVETARARELAVGDCLFGVPWHICPTVSLHSEAVVIRQNQAQERWIVAARERHIRF